MSSLINPLNPTSLTPTTQSVRDNFSAAKTEIEALQTSVTDHVGSGSISHSVATISEAGFMAATDKIKLDSLSGSSGGTAIPPEFHGFLLMGA